MGVLDALNREQLYARCRVDTAPDAAETPRCLNVETGGALLKTNDLRFHIEK